MPRPSVATERNLHLNIGTEGRNATLTNAMSRHAIFGLNRKTALAAPSMAYGASLRQWKMYFERWNVRARHRARCQSAFRHADDIGAHEIGLKKAA